MIEVIMAVVVVMVRTRGNAISWSRGSSNGC